MRKILLGFLALVTLVLVVALGVLTWAHVEIRRQRSPLPQADALSATAQGPLTVSFVNTASQEMPRSGVLDSGHDPNPEAPYVMSHPSFVLEWEDGRILLVDAGMTRSGAAAFGRPIEALGGAKPIVPLGSVVEHLGAKVQNVQGIIFTHLHEDHVGGIVELCTALRHGARVFMTRAQAEVVNYLTSSGRRMIDEASCVEEVTLLDTASPLALPGFPGASVIAAAGHTPGSQIIVAHVGRGNETRRYVFVGDIVNNIDGITHDIPKPWYYSWFIVPEDGTRLGELRRFLRGLRDQHGFVPLVSHDQLDLERQGIPVISGKGAQAPKSETRGSG